MTDAYDEGAEPLPVPGSRRHPFRGARRVADADPGSQVNVTVVLRRAWDEPGAPADPHDVAAIKAFAEGAGLQVVSVNLAARAVRLRGDVASMNAAFSVRLGHYVSASSGSYRGREHSIYIPSHLDGTVIAVLGLDARPRAEAHFRIATPHAAVAGTPPQKIAEAYGFPTDVDGTGQTVAVIELGGGFSTTDLASYFAEQGIRLPNVEAVSVDGATNAPGQSDADGEVMLDIEVIGAIAPGADIAVYFGPNTDNGFYDAIAAAVHDTQRHPSIISISWGQAESEWTASALDAYDALLADAAAAGISVFVASGDNGASDGEADGQPHVDFPAASPSVVGCGGTTLRITERGATEVVWNELNRDEGATGGGYSHHFAIPAYQSGVVSDESDGRGVPDVAGNADPSTGYLVRVNGQDQVIGGTSAVAPLWAALTALANQRNGVNAGAPHRALYTHPAAFRDITSGNNDGYDAAVGWDPCTGLGTPLGIQIIAALAPPETGTRPIPTQATSSEPMTSA